MKSPITFIFAALVLLIGTGSILTIMNSACKAGQHSWVPPSL